MSRMLTISGSFIDRVVALVLLVLFVPALALVAFLLRTNTDEPILLTDALVARDGKRVQS